MRFRRLEDEARHQALRTELVAGLAEALRHDPVALVDLLRNLDKLERFVFTEGVDQGHAATVIATVQDLDENLLGTEVHRIIYGGSDTPLLERERAIWDEVSDDDWRPRTLVEPREYVPLTLGEVEERLEARVPVRPPHVAPPAGLLEPLESLLGFTEERMGIRSDIAQSVDDLQLRIETEITNGATTSPHVLDVIRDHLLERVGAGWKPTEWAEVVLAVAEGLHMTPVYADMHLSSVEGRAVLEQAGIFELSPSSVGRILDERPVDA